MKLSCFNVFQTCSTGWRVPLTSLPNICVIFQPAVQPPKTWREGTWAGVTLWERSPQVRRTPAP